MSEILDSTSPDAETTYKEYVEHVEKCLECQPHRCGVGDELCQVYLEAVRRP
ncbi:hypothetical protein [Streptomyces sp. V3I7]|uniref:hypothetical protein n=1 Tax=Streptomyces sp. V3I7 TaxID=3042278 RepID=UPI00277DFFAF|nr:hypothetical protein [Streptomyces sp. V3I7]MDQ0989233.1 hypothetical protein [Streptomyces sp. V3I7]